jgi:ATP-dependent Clp protease protease subunit
MNSVSIIEQAQSRMAVLDLQSKLLQNNNIFLTEEVNEESIATIQAELFYLASKMTPEESKSDPITIYINSPGGEVYSCLGLYDVMQLFINQGYVIRTINIGLAASAAAVILLAGSKGYRYCLPHSTTMLHQPSSGTYGTITDMKIAVTEGDRLKKLLNDIVIQHASEQVVELMERDAWISPEEALKFNLIDEIKR